MKITRSRNILAAALMGLLIVVPPVHAETDNVTTDTGGAVADEKAQSAELAKKLSNPVANLISVPIQYNWDFGSGKTNAERHTINIQPVIPFSLTKDWNLITRTILPIIYGESPIKGGEDEGGLGDIVQSFFLSPKKPVHGWILGAGPVFLYPTATNDKTGSSKMGMGPTLVLLQQKKGWTYGVLANHIWSIAGSHRRKDVNATFLQPFVSYTTKKFTTFTLNTESTYNWNAGQWSVPLNAQVSQLLKIGKMPISIGIGGRYYANGPKVGPKSGPDWGLRFVVQFLFPKS